MTTNARIERTGIGGKYAVRVTAEGGGLRFAITSPGKTHASAVLIPKDAKGIAQFVTTATAALLAVFIIAAIPLAHADDNVKRSDLAGNADGPESRPDSTECAFR